MADKKKVPSKRRPAGKAKAPAAKPTAEEIQTAVERRTVQVEIQPRTLADTFTAENVEKFIMGEITWAQLMGLTREEAFGIAEFGYKLYVESRYHDARTIFEGLVLANPFDSYFHNMLGAVYQQLDLKDEALSQYTRAIECDEQSAHPRINRGEMFLREGRFEEAIVDLEAAIALHKGGDDQPLERARALAQTAKALVEGLKIVRQPATVVDKKS